MSCNDCSKEPTTVILIGVLLPITFIIGGVFMYRCYKKSKSGFTAKEYNENTQLQTVAQGKENVVFKHSMSQTHDNGDALENKEYLVSRQPGGSCSSSLLEKTLDVFISYRRSNGSPLASLLKVNLENRKFSVFLDVDR